MADQKISALPLVGSLAATDEFAIETAGASKKVTGTLLAAFVQTTNTSSTTPAAIGTAAVGTGATNAKADHVHATGALTPVSQAFGDTAAVGTGPSAAMTDHRHAMPNSTAGPDANITIDAAGAAGSANTAARAGHGHQLVTSAVAAVALGAAAAGTSGHSPARDDHVHPTTGLALDPHGAGQHTDITRSLFLAASVAGLDVATLSQIGASPDFTKVVAYADAATNGAYWTFQVPADWASGVITIQPVWSPGSSDGTAHTVRWSVTAKTAPAGSTVTGAGTTTAFTGSSGARTAGVLVYDTATSTTLTPAAANDLFRFELQRIGADAADTYVGIVNLLGVIATYTANQ